MCRLCIVCWTESVVTQLQKDPSTAVEINLVVCDYNFSRLCKRVPTEPLIICLQHEQTTLLSVKLLILISGLETFNLEGMHIIISCVEVKKLSPKESSSRVALFLHEFCYHFSRILCSFSAFTISFYVSKIKSLFFLNSVFNWVSSLSS